MMDKKRLKEFRARRKARRKEFHDKYIERLMHHYGKDIINSENFQQSDENIQHGDVSVKEHSLSVTRSSIRLAKFLKIRFSHRDLIRGALLHDYFLYDWHIPDPTGERKLHGFAHPYVALRNAEKEYELSDRQRNIISRHMWPLTLKPPTCREAWVVTMADKYVSLKETLRGKRKKGSKPRKHGGNS